jgi:hypothetical protein
VVEDWWAGSSPPGLAYVVVSLPADVASAVGYTLTLKTKTNGTAGAGRPAYEDVDGLTPPQADSRLVSQGTNSTSTEAETRDTDTSTSSPSKDPHGGLPWLPSARAQLSSPLSRPSARWWYGAAAPERCVLYSTGSPSERAMSIRCTSLVPSPISRIFASR